MSEVASQPSKGTFSPAQSTDLRSPCPMINCLANHGFLPRDGRSVHAAEMYDAVSGAGLGMVLASGFTTVAFREYHASDTMSSPPHHHKKPPPSRGWLGQLLAHLDLAKHIGMRRPGQNDSMGRPVLDLDELARPGVIEHDISLTRRDHQQPQGNNALQRDLVEGLLAASQDGKMITRGDLANYRKKRIAVQKEENPEAYYGTFEHLLSCGEISLILSLIGDGDMVPVNYLRAFLLEERLPLQEGWKPRRWWKLGFITLQINILKVWRLVGKRG